MEELTKGDRKLLSDIANIGWHVVLVAADESGPGFGYSVGLFNTFGHSEIIITGLKPDLIHILINNIGEEIRKGKKYETGQMYDDIVESYDCCMLPVDKNFYREYVGYSIWYYKGKNFPLLQCVYPNKDGIFPWQKNCPERFKNFQPVLHKGN